MVECSMFFRLTEPYQPYIHANPLLVMLATARTPLLVCYSLSFGVYQKMFGSKPTV